MGGLAIWWYSIGMRNMDMEARTIRLPCPRLILPLLHFVAETHGGDDPLQPGQRGLVSHMTSGCKSSMRAPPHSATLGAHRKGARRRHSGVRGRSSVCVHTIGTCPRRERMRGQRYQDVKDMCGDSPARCGASVESGWAEARVRFPL